MGRPTDRALLTLNRAERSYRKKSLLIHPDKLKHERGIEAFDLLKKVGPAPRIRPDSPARANPTPLARAPTHPSPAPHSSLPAGSS